MNFRDIYLKLSSLFPEGAKERTRILLAQGGFIDFSASVYLGFVLFFSFSIGLITFFLFPFIFENFPLWFYLFSAFVIFFFSAVLFYVFLLFSARARAESIETMLPTVLQMIASNIRAGLIVEHAIWASVKKEFGPLEAEIRRISGLVFAGFPVTYALKESSKRVKSNIYKRAMNLMVEGILLGGSLAPLLEEVAQNIRQAEMLKKELSAATITYSIFILFASVVAAPLLFSISTYYSQMNERVWAQHSQDMAELQSLSSNAGISGIALSFLGSSNRSINSEHIYYFSLAALFIITFFSSLILGAIKENHFSEGLKYFPFISLTSMLIYVISNYLFIYLFRSFI